MRKGELDDTGHSFGFGPPKKSKNPAMDRMLMRLYKKDHQLLMIEQRVQHENDTMMAFKALYAPVVRQLSRRGQLLVDRRSHSNPNLMIGGRSLQPEMTATHPSPVPSFARIQRPRRTSAPAIHVREFSKSPIRPGRTSCWC